MKTRALTRFDEDRILELYRGLSGESRTLRFGVPTPCLSTWAIFELVTLDGHMRSAIGVFEEDGTLVAEGRWVRLHERPHAAEAAFTVADAYQRRGIGSGLLDAVIEAARDAGIETLHFTVSGENRGMAALLRRYGVRLGYRGGSGEGTLRLEPALAAAGTGDAVARRTA